MIQLVDVRKMIATEQNLHTYTLSTYESVLLLVVQKYSTSRKRKNTVLGTGTRYRVLFKPIPYHVQVPDNTTNAESAEYMYKVLVLKGPLWIWWERQKVRILLLIQLLQFK